MVMNFKIICRDVTYVTSSGSIIAAAGYRSNGVNVVIWDTLAPPATSQASIICHEGFLPLSFSFCRSSRKEYNHPRQLVRVSGREIIFVHTKNSDFGRLWISYC